MTHIKNIKIRSHICWFLFAAVFIFEYLLFRSYVLREIVNYYPANFDQASYLPISYSIYEHILSHGLWKTIFSVATWNIAPNTVLFLVQGALFYLFFGASRLSALTLNFIYFIILQITIIKMTKTITKKYSMSAIFLGLLLTIHTPFMDAGGLVDFRIDFIAFCLFGLFITSVIKSQIFLDRKWTLIASFVAVILILFRTITITYIIGISMLMLCYFLFKKYKNSTINVKERLKNLLIFISIVCVAILPFFWMLKNKLYNYYVVGHITGSEKYIRARLSHTLSLKSDLLYYPTSIIRNHLGHPTLILCLVLIVVLLLGFLVQKKYNKLNLNLATSYKEGLVFFSFCIIVPLIILILDLSKSQIVGGIVAVPFLWLIMWLAIYLFQRQSWSVKKNRILYILAIICMLAGTLNYINRFAKHGPFYRQDNASQITKMYMDIGNYAVSSGWNKKDVIRLSIDRVNEYITSGGLQTLYYEKHHVLLNVGTTRLGGRIFAINKKQAMIEFDASDIFIINLGSYPSGVTYPYNTSIKPILPELKRLAKRRFIKLGDYKFYGSTFRVYVKPSVQISGISAKNLS